MSEISAEERRRLRQERIKANAGGRLAKITAGNKGRAPDSVSADTTTPSAAATAAAAVDSVESPALDSLPSARGSAPVAPQTPQSPSDFSDLVGGSAGSSTDDDPLFKLLSTLNSNPMSGGKPQDFNDFASQFASMMGMANPVAGGDGSGVASPGFADTPLSPPPVPEPKSRRADLLWTALHFVMFLVLALSSRLVFSQAQQFSEQDVDLLYASSENPNAAASPSRLLWHFSTLELILQTSRFFLEHGAPPADSKLTKFASYLPHPFSSYLYTSARYVRMVKTIVQDFCLLLFVAGLYSLSSR